jgi:hypothetical protein
MFRKFYARTSIRRIMRLRSLEGLILLSPLRMNGISNDQDVMDYALNKASEELLNSLHLKPKFYS